MFSGGPEKQNRAVMGKYSIYCTPLLLTRKSNGKKQHIKHAHCVKSVQMRSFCGPYFPVFGLNTEIYCVNLCIQLEVWKIWTRKNSVFGHFPYSGIDKNPQTWRPQKSPNFLTFCSRQGRKRT